MTPNILLIADQDDWCITELEQALNAQYRVLKITDGKRALQLIASQPVAVVLVARCLPQMNGLEVLQCIKNVNPDLPVICLAAEPGDEFIIEAFRSGAADFFKTPFDVPQVLASVSSILEVRHMRRSTRALLDSVQKLGPGLPQANTHSFLSKLSHILENLGKAVQSRRQVAEVQPKTIATRTPPEPAPLRVNFFGTFHLILREQKIQDWPGKKGKCVLAYLLFHHKRKIVRDALMDKFWPDSTSDSARNCLNVTLHGIRSLLQEYDPVREYILFKDECYFVNPEIDLTLDVEEFKYYWRLAQSIEREKGTGAALGEYELAAALYKGDFMEGELYESWTSLDRENLKEIYLVILDRLSSYYSCDGKPATAIHLCETILERDACREEVHRRLMKCYYRMGQRDKAIKQFHKCTRVLKDELEVKPTKSTFSLYSKIKQDSLEKNGQA